MMDYITLAFMASAIILIFTLTACTCTVMVALTRKLIRMWCGVPEKKEKKIIDVSNKRAKKTQNKPTEQQKEA